MLKHRLLESLPPAIYVRLKYWDYRLTHSVRFKETQEMRIRRMEEGFSYRSFDEKKAIFVHIPKCAGIAISQTLFGTRGGGHATLQEYMNIFEPRCIANYFKFTVVRNPWDRVVSAFFFIKGGGMDKQNDNGFKKEFGDSVDFRSFVRRWLNRTNVWRRYFFHPQYHYMLEKRGKVHLDFVAFFENIDIDIHHIADRIGVGCTLVKSNSSEHSSYMDYYDKETMDIVSAVYAEDIEMFGYNFDNSSLQAQLLSRRNGKVFSLRP